MRLFSIAGAVLTAAFIAAGTVSAPAQVATRAPAVRTTMAPAPAGLQAFTTPSVCAQHSDVPNCTGALEHGLVLFTWTCANCDPNWQALFVVNGQPGAVSDLTLAPSKHAALSVRANQFKSADCVAVRIYNPAQAGQQATSNAVCLAQVMAAHVTVAPPAANVRAAPAAGAAVATAKAPAAVSASFVPTPSGMGSTHDPHMCASHGGTAGSLACSAALPAGQLALVWTCHGCKVSGYRLYRVDNGQHTLLPANGAYASDATITLALLEPPGDGFNGKCWAVAAYNGSNESTLSNSWCAGAGSTISSMTLQPGHALHWQHYRPSRTGVIGHTDKPIDTYDATIYVGYADHYWNNEFGDSYDDYIHRSGVYFDLSPLAGKTVSKAVLQFNAFSSWHDYDNTSGDAPNLTAQSTEACVARIYKATDHWWENNDLASKVSYSAPGNYNGPTFGIDVTSAIAGWLKNPSTNFGFILAGSDENDTWHGNRNNVCLTQLESVALVVSYH